jgi:hypothetical protein
MADASGLTAAQAEANQIPYKNIALGNPAETFLNAWALSTGLKLKQQEFEGRMASLAAKNKELEANDALKEKKFALDIQRVTNAAEHQGNMYELARTRADNEAAYKDRVMNFRELQYNNQAQGQGGIYDAIAQVHAQGYLPGKRGPDGRTFDQALLQATQPYMPLVGKSTYNKIIGPMLSDHNTGADSERKFYESEVKHIDQDIGGAIWGDPLNNNKDPIMHPEMYQYKEPTGWFGMGSGKPTDKIVTKGKDALGNPKDIITSLADITKMRQRVLANEQLRTQLAPKVNRPDMGVSQYEPMPANKADLQIGHTYQGASGAGTWNGTDFDPVQ